MIKHKVINYITANVRLRGNESVVIKGYVLAVLPINAFGTHSVVKGEDYIWMFREKSVQILSTKYYFVSQVNVGYGDKTSETTSYTVDKAAEGINFLLNLQKQLKDDNKLTANGLINVMAFLDVPEYLKKEIESKPTTTHTTTTGSIHNTVANTTTVVDNQKQIGYVRKEVSTGIIKRTTKYSITQAMEAMRKKLIALKNGEYKAPKLSEIPADKEADDTDYYDDYGYYGRDGWGGRKGWGF